MWRKERIPRGGCAGASVCPCALRSVRCRFPHRPGDRPRAVSRLDRLSVGTPECGDMGCENSQSNASCAAKVTTLLNAAGTGDRRASAELLPLVYEQLRALAGRKMR